VSRLDSTSANGDTGALKNPLRRRQGAACIDHSSLDVFTRMAKQAVVRGRGQRLRFFCPIRSIHSRTMLSEKRMHWRYV
jgi:hypothetical protein